MESGSGGGGSALLADSLVGLPSENWSVPLGALIIATGLTNVKNSGGWGNAGGGAEQCKQ